MSDRKTVLTNRAPAPVGPYSQAVRAGGFLYVSGQLGLPPTGGDLPNTFDAQVRAVMDNVMAVLEAGGASAADVVKTTCFLADMDDFPAFNAVYAEYFNDDPPARSCVAVKTLPKNALVEMEAIAIVGNHKTD